MIDPIKANELKSIPASIPASTPLRPSFRGEEPKDTVEISGEAKEAAAAEEKKKPLSAEEIRKKSEEFSESVDAFADNIDKTTDSVTNAATKAAGGITAITAMFGKLIPPSVKNFFAPLQPKMQAVLNEDGTVLMKDGKEVLQAVKDEAGKVIKTRKANWKHIGIAAAATAAVVIATKIIKGIKNKAKAPKAPAAQKIEA